jgi:hypothetical protein
MTFRDWINISTFDENTNLDNWYDRVVKSLGLTKVPCEHCGGNAITDQGKAFVCHDCHKKWYAQGYAEAAGDSRYSVEVNYRSKLDEVLHAYAKIVLGYISAGIKHVGYHVKHVYDEHPLRILVGSRAFDDGEWTAVVSFNPKHDGGSFIISSGFYNKDRKTVHLQNNKKCDGKSAAEIVSELRNVLHSFKDMKDRYQVPLKPVPMRRGPKS